jgi:hypothetical protein
MTTPVHAAPAFEDPVPPTFQPQPAVPLPAYEQQGIPQAADQEAVTSVQVPVGGYAKRIVRLPMPQFALPGLPDLWIEIRNPGLLAQSTIEEMQQGLRGVTVDEAGEPGEADSKLILETMSSLLRRWCMWDATSDDDIPPLLPETVTVADLSRAPLGVLGEIGKAFRELQNPQ